MTFMASLETSHARPQLEGLEPREYFKTFAIAVPTPGHPPILLHSGEEAYSTVLEIIATNKYLSERAAEISSKSATLIGTLRGLATVLNLEVNKSEETGLHLANIERMLEIVEKDADIGYQISRIKLLKFERMQHLKAEEDLALAERELHMVQEDLDEAIKQMVKFEKLRKVLNDCIRAGHDSLAVF